MKSDLRSSTLRSLLVIGFCGSLSWGNPVSGVTLQQVDYAGTGCPAGTLRFEKNEHGLSPLFLNQFRLESRGGLARRTCQLALTYEVPPGVQIGLAPVHEIRGVLSLPLSSSTLTVSSEVFLAGQRGPVLKTQEKGRQSRRFQIQNEVLLSGLTWSHCGESVTVRVQFSAVLQNSSKRTASATVDTIQLMKSGRVYWRQCQ
jgi:hypothetical protein